MAHPGGTVDTDTQQTSSARDGHSLVGMCKQLVLKQCMLGAGDGRKGSENAWMGEFLFSKKKKKPEGGN